jgi:hypothetical protein
VVGIALNGVFIYAGVTHLGFDPFYPKPYGTKTNAAGYSFDVCLGTQVTNRQYRYHSYSPCVFAISLRNTAMLCSDSPACSKNITKYALDNTPTLSRGLLPVGIARDGKVIYGPYKTGQTLW